MQRRSFIKSTALGAVAVSTCGFVRFDGNNFVGDCETTTDILGPFYRPGSPVRNNLVIPGDEGIPIELSGTIKHNDCKTPYAKAKIELWHTSPKGVYDNSSDEFRYRGTSYSDEKGRYMFNTILPVPYETGPGSTRPAHFHIMITARGYQPFVTQLYFAGDKYISHDSSASSPKAKRRILDLQTLKDGSRKVKYDVSMSPKLAAETGVITRLAGVYTIENDKNKIEFFKSGDLLWMKNQVYGLALEYTGNNMFHYPGLNDGESWTFHFEIMTNGRIKVTRTMIESHGLMQKDVAVKGI